MGPARCRRCRDAGQAARFLDAADRRNAGQQSVAGLSRHILVTTLTGDHVHSVGMNMIGNPKNALRPFEPWIPLRTPRLSWQRSLGSLKSQGFAPAIVFDVGVRFGTYGLYPLFPDAFYHLIEPTPES